MLEKKLRTKLLLGGCHAYPPSLLGAIMDPKPLQEVVYCPIIFWIAILMVLETFLIRFGDLLGSSCRYFSKNVIFRKWASRLSGKHVFEGLGFQKATTNQSTIELIFECFYGLFLFAILMIFASILRAEIHQKSLKGYPTWCSIFWRFPEMRWRRFLVLPGGMRGTGGGPQEGEDSWELGKRLARHLASGLVWP